MPAPYSTLEQIYIKVRRLTRSPSANQLTDDDINDYVNTFLLYELPEELRLFDYRRIFTFYTQPYVDTYSTTYVDPNDPFYQFKNKYVSIHEPLYIAGFRRFFSQSREQFFGLYPYIQSQQALPGLGDGGTVTFTGTVNGSPLIRNYVMFTSIDVNNNGLVLQDVPFLTGDPNFPTFGNLVVPNNPSPAALDPLNNINYVTGQFTCTFPFAPAQGIQIYSQTVPNVAAIPQAILYYDDTFTLRPIPDQVYKVEFECYVQPIELLSTDTTQEPYLQAWAQYIAYGAARKVFQDRMDMESLQMIEPEFKRQERLTVRRTIVQLTNQRTSTIFTEGNANWPYGGWGWFNGNS